MRYFQTEIKQYVQTTMDNVYIMTITLKILITRLAIFIISFNLYSCYYETN